jgi:hypothetical protein
MINGFVKKATKKIMFLMKEIENRYGTPRGARRTLVVTLRISRSAGAQSFGGAHRGRVCVRVFIGVSVHACCERLRCTV